MITDIKIFKNELGMYNHYKKQLKKRQDELQATYTHYSSPLAVEEYLDYVDGTFIKKTALKQRTGLSNEMRIELDDKIFRERERLRGVIKYYQDRINEVDTTLELLDDTTSGICKEIYINRKGYRFVAANVKVIVLLLQSLTIR